MYVVRSRRGCVGRGGLGPGGLFCEKRRTDPGSGGSDPSPGSAGLTSPEPGGQGGRPSPSGGKNPTQTGAPPPGNPAGALLWGAGWARARRDLGIPGGEFHPRAPPTAVKWGQSLDASSAQV